MGVTKKLSKSFGMKMSNEFSIQSTVFSTNRLLEKDQSSQAVSGKGPSVHKRLRSIISKVFVPNQLDSWNRQLVTLSSSSQEKYGVC